MTARTATPSSDIRTARLTLRAPRLADSARLAALVGNLEVSRWLARVPHPYREPEAHAFLVQAAENAHWGIAASFAIERAGDGMLIGMVGADDLDRPVAHIGWWLGEPYWGHGYMSEAVEAVLTHVFARGVTRLRSGAFAGNARSLRIQEKMGFAVTGTSLQHCLARRVDLEHTDTMLTAEAFAARGGRARR
jgi:RimJ/RimL family protein N-acetyltransferase